MTTNIHEVVAHANLLWPNTLMSDQDWIEFKVKLVRKNASLSDLAKFLGITRQAVCKWRNQGIPENRVADVQRFLDDAA